MNNKQLLTGAIALIIGLGGGYFLRGEDTRGMHRMPDGTMMEDIAESGMQNQMHDMMMGLEGKSGDAFDQAFLAEMIVHHEGAVDMAEAALKSSGHTELKEMAQAIISAQTAEIAQMKAWQASWYRN